MNTQTIEKYTVSVNKSQYSKENPAMKQRRISLTLNTLLVWVGRHIVRDHHHGSEWFGAKEEGEDFVFWFKLKQDRDKAEIFLAEIQENGIPKNNK
jgi:hypothetical protein